MMLSPRCSAVLAISAGLVVSSMAARAQPPEIFTDLPREPLYGQAVGITSITVGENPGAPPVIGIFTGLLEIDKWPGPGFEAKVLSTGEWEITAALDSTIGEAVRARSANLQGVGRVYVWLDPAKRSVGILKTLSDEHGHSAAEGDFDLWLLLQTPQGILHNKDAVELEAHVHTIPPVATPFKLTADTTPEELERIMEELGDVNTWHGVNLPVALYDESDVIRAYFTPQIHKTVLVGHCGDEVDNELDGRVDEELPDNVDNDRDGLVDEDATCPD